MKVAKMLRSSRFLLAIVFTVAGLLMSGCGDNGTEETTVVVPPTPVVPASPVMALFAGNVGGYGNVDGTGTAARFNGPNAVATDSGGNVYVADTYNSTIRKISPAGVVTTLAGTAEVTGSTDATGAAASFSEPQGIATDSAGNVYVSDTQNCTIRKITPVGAVTTLAGTAGQCAYLNDNGAAARFNKPRGIAVDSDGNVFVADSETNSIRKITPSGDVSTFAEGGGIDFPNGLAIDSDRNVYVVNDPNNVGEILKITTEAAVSVLIPGAPGFVPSGIAVDSDFNVYVSYSNYNVIAKFDALLNASLLAGSDTGLDGYVDATGNAARFNYPLGIAIDSAGNVYVAEGGNTVIRKITSLGAVTTLAGAAYEYGDANGTGAAARFDLPNGFATDRAGNVYVADTDNNSIRKITPTGVVTTFAGSATGLAGNTDGPGTTALFDAPWGVATDSSDNVYVADYNNDTIRKITPAGVVSTLIDTATGFAAVFAGPNDVAVDSAGNVYVAAYSNSTIGKITPGGVVSTLAGTGTAGYTNGTGTLAQFNEPWGIATDSAGNVYVTDAGNNAIRKIDTSGMVSTFAGSATGLSGSADGTGISASFNFPVYLAIDSAGNVYVTDNGNNTIRKITPAGVVTTLAGTVGQAGFTPGALPGVLSSPEGIAIFGTTLYFASNNGVVSITNLP
jgi:sugar lactone lactonase YvrE